MTPIALAKVYRATGERHSECRDCRRQSEPHKRHRGHTQAVRGALHEVRRRQTPDTIIAVLEGVIHKVGGIRRFVDIWAELLASKEMPTSYRVATCNTLLHVGSVYDLQKLLSTDATPLDTARRMHEERKLAPVVREMLDTGELT